MRQIEISSVKIKDGTVTIVYTETLKDGQVSLTHNSTIIPHDDFINAFRKLNTHLAAICDQWAKDGTPSGKVTCRKFSLSGEDDKRGIVLSGVRELYDGKVVALNTPFVFFLSDSRNYPEMKSLEKDLAEVNKETLSYLIDNKHAPDMQMNMFDDNGDAMKEPENKQPTTFGDAVSAIRWSKLQNNVLYLPKGEYETGTMEMLEEKLGNIGGKNTKKNPLTFTFADDPSPLLNALAGGKLIYIQVTKPEEV